MFICCSSSFLPKLQRFINFLNKCIIFNMKRGVSDLWFQYDISDNHIYFAKSYIHPIRSWAAKSKGLWSRPSEFTRRWLWPLGNRWRWLISTRRNDPRSKSQPFRSLSHLQKRVPASPSYREGLSCCLWGCRTWGEWCWIQSFSWSCPQRKPLSQWVGLRHDRPKVEERTLPPKCCWLSLQLPCSL